MAGNPFTKHPKEVGESYGRHFVAATSFGIRLIGAGAACILHGIFPFMFTNTGSNTIRQMHSGLVKRVDKPNWERHPII